MSKLIDITGNRYNHLVVLEKARVENGVAIWKCLCDCGNITYVRGQNLKSGAVKSCGCLRKAAKPTLKHNMSNTRLYRIWAAMKCRCYTPSHHSYNNYGGRGIKVFDLWKNSSDVFIDWAINNGYTDDMTIERIDVDGDYCPENCTWIPANKQQSNRTSCQYFTHNNETKNLTDWCSTLNLPYKQVHNRIYKLHWSFERAISEPVHVDKRNKKG